MKPFFEQVYEIVAQIPSGKVVSYGQIARMLGAPRAARQVGWAMRRCPEGMPWYRVIKADGSVAGGMFPELWGEMLAQEDIIFLPDGRVDMTACAWDGCGRQERDSAEEKKDEGSIDNCRE